MSAALRDTRHCSPAPKLYPPFALPVVLHLGGEPKVTNLDPHFIVEEEVPKFDVAVYDVGAVEVVHGQQGLLHQVAHLRLSQSLAALVQLHEGLGGEGWGLSGETREGW